MKTVTLYVDGAIAIADVAKALATIGLIIQSDASGEIHITKKRRNRKPAPGPTKAK